MNEVHRMQAIEDGPLEGPDRERVPVTKLAADPLPKPPDRGRRSFEPWLLGGGALLLLVGGLAFGASQLSAHNRQVMAISEQQQNFVPNVRVAEVRASDSTMVVSLPATTLAFAAANIFARANGYIEKRQVDIGDHVKAGDLLAQITAPELDHQIAQNEATLRQNQATLQQTIASRDLASVTNTRDSVLVTKGWVTAQQGDTDRLTLKAQEAAVAVAQSNIAAQQSFIRVLNQQKAYQSVIAPFDGIITQRSVDVGSLVQAGTTFMFTLMQSDVIRTQVYVPQNAAFGVQPGVEAVIRVPEMPDRTFPGKVTRLADALAPGTRTLLTEIDVPNPEGTLRPGMYCTVELHIPRKTPSFIVPADALIFNANGLQVAVVENGIAHLRKVNVARDLGREVEVRDGVQLGDLVILKPMVDLADGSKVRPQMPQTQMNSELETIQGRPQHDAIGGRRRSFDAASLSGSSGLGPLCLRHDFRAVTDDPIDGAYGPDQSDNPIDGAWGPDQSDAFRRCRRWRTRRHSTQFGKPDPRARRRPGQHHNMSHDRDRKLQRGRWRLTGDDDRYVRDRSIRDVSAGGDLQPIDTDNCGRISATLYHYPVQGRSLDRRLVTARFRSMWRKQGERA